MFVAAGQFAVEPSWEKNAETCALLMSQAAGEGRCYWYYRRHCWRVTILTLTCQ